MSIWQASEAKRARVLADERRIEAELSETNAKTARQTAESQRRDALEARDDAEELISFMMGDLKERLEPIGKLELMEDVGSVVQDYYESLPDESNQKGVNHAKALGVLSEIALATVNRDEAMQLNRRQVEILEEARSDQSGEPDLDLAIALADAYEQHLKLLNPDRDRVGGLTSDAAQYALSKVREAVSVLKEVETRDEVTSREIRARFGLPDGDGGILPRRP